MVIPEEEGSKSVLNTQRCAVGLRRGHGQGPGSSQMYSGECQQGAVKGGLDTENSLKCAVLEETC